jgi:hypothetical protein
MVGVITLSPSQRGAYEPASCLRGPVVDTPSARKPRRSRRGGCHAQVALEEGVETILTLDDDFTDIENLTTDVILSPAEFETLNQYINA